MHEAWERYKELLRKCPHLGLPRWMQIQNFYMGLDSTTQTMIDVSVGGALMKKNENEAYELLEDMVNNLYMWSYERSMPHKKTDGIQEKEVIARLTT